MTSLPYGRNTTYAPDSPIKSADLNDLQDSVAAGAHGDGFALSHPFACAMGANATRNAAGYVAFSAAGDVSWSPQLRAGDRVASFALRLYGNGATQVAINVWVMDASNSLTNIGPGAAATTVTPPNGAWGTTTIDLTDTTLANTESLFVTIETDGGSVRLGNLKLGESHPF